MKKRDIEKAKREQENLQKLKEIQENTDESIRISKTEPIDMYRTDLKELKKKSVQDMQIEHEYKKV